MMDHQNYLQIYYKRFYQKISFIKSNILKLRIVGFQKQKFWIIKSLRKYIWFLDSDDYLIKNWSTKIYKAINYSQKSDVIALDFLRFLGGKEENVPWLTHFCQDGHYNYENYVDCWYNIGNKY